MALNTPIPATTSISSWERANKHVEANIRSGRYVNAETCLVFAGPPRASDIGGLNNLGQAITVSGDRASVLTNGATLGNDALYPIGLVEQFGIQQVQTVQKFFEIGARRSYQSAGRVQLVGNLGRVLFNGPSLLRVLYAYYPGVVALANGQALGPGQGDSVSRGILGATDGQSGIFPSIFFEPGSRAGVDPEASDDAAHSFFGNLMSELFSHPFGLGLLLRDNRNRNYAAMYLEDCFITTHSFAVNSSSTLITEAASFQADAAIPMEFSTDRGASGVGPQVALLTP
jgi:hypothetical protein